MLSSNFSSSTNANKKSSDDADSKVINHVHHTYNFWHDKCIRFDTITSDLRLRSKCEYVYSTFDEVEDVKGNMKQHGTLTVTNLRVMWAKSTDKSSNLSIGLGTIHQVGTKTMELRQPARRCRSCMIVSKFQNCRYQFLFAKRNERGDEFHHAAKRDSGPSGQAGDTQPVGWLRGSARSMECADSADTHARMGGMLRSSCSSSNTNKNLNDTKNNSGNSSYGSGQQNSSRAAERGAEDGVSVSAASTVTAPTHSSTDSDTIACMAKVMDMVHVAYEDSRPYRDVLLRASIVQDGRLTLLAREQVISQTTGVNQVSKDEGIVGVLIVTNIRVVWFAALNEGTSVSVPYMQFVSVCSQKGKFGFTLVLETSTYASSVVFGFGVGTLDRLKTLFIEVSRMWKAWSAKPMVGMPSKEELLAIAMPPKHAREEAERGETGEVYVRKPAGLKKPPTIWDSTHGVDDRAVLRPVCGDTTVLHGVDSAGAARCDSRPVYDYTVGLAMERLPDGVTLNDLWAIPLP